MAKRKKIDNTIWTGLLTILALLYVYPVVMIFFNSLKQETAIKMCIRDRSCLVRYIQKHKLKALPAGT